MTFPVSPGVYPRPCHPSTANQGCLSTLSTDFKQCLKTFISEEEKILRSESFQTLPKITKAIIPHLTDILGGFRRRFVKTESIATFGLLKQTFLDFLEQNQKLAQKGV